MAGTTTAVQTIVDEHCHKLLTEMQKGHPGADLSISVALFYPGNPEVPGFFGYCVPKGTQPTAATVYAIGSVTKVFTASLAAYLEVDNKIGLGDPVASYLSNPACNPPGVSGDYWTGSAGVTFQQFATQTSGMPDEANGPYSNQLFADQPPSCPQLRWWDDNTSSFTDNEGSWIYSSAGFVTLGFAVAAAANMGYTDLLDQVITTPLNMPYTFAADDVPPNAVLVQGYNERTKPVQITAAADLKSSAADMLTFLTAIYDAMQLAASGASLTSLQQALANTTNIWIAQPKKPNGQSTPFAMGLAWQIPTFDSAQVLSKNGATSKGGCSCWVGLTRYAASVPAVGIALMTNQIGVHPDPTAQAILEEIIALG